jgi:branched-chain amino acid transport system substrate-binding protein
MFKPILLLALACTPAHALWGSVRVGAALPLSGSKADRGLSILHAAQMKVDEINAAGGVGGRTLELIVRDDEDKPEKAAAIAGEFASDAKILAVIGDYDDEPALKAVPIYDRAGLPVYFPAISNPEIIHSSPFAFSGTYSDDRSAETLAAYLSIVRGFKSAVIFYNEGTYGEHLLQAFTRKASRLGLRVRSVGYSGSSPLPDDFVAKNMPRSENPDAVVLFSHIAQGAPLIKQLRGRGVKAPIFGSDRLASNLYETLGPLTDDIHIAFPFLYDFASLKGIKFHDRFKSLFREQPTVFAAFAYDGVGMLARAISKKADRAAIREFLASDDDASKAYSGVSGELYFDHDRSMVRDTVMGFQRGGQWKPCFTQLRRVTEPHTLHILPEKIKLGEVVVADGVPFFKIQVIYVGVDYYRVNQVSAKDLNFESEFFLWFKWEGDADIENIGFINELPGRGSRVELRNNFAELKEHEHDGHAHEAEKWEAFKIKGVFVDPYELKLFPFDTQHLPLLIAHRSKNANKIRLVADVTEESNRRITDIFPQEWHYLGREDFSGTFNFESNFGNPDYRPGESQADYSVYQSNMVIKRILFPYVITLFMPLALLMGVSLLVLLIPKEQFSPRNSLVMSSLLGVLVYHMAQARALPQVGYLMRADLYFVVAYFLLFALILGLNAVNLLIAHGKEQTADRLDLYLRRYFAVVMLVAYALLTLSAFWTTAAP